MTISTVGLDLAKSVFQVHAVDGDGTVFVRKQLRRNKVLAFFAELPPCLVGEALCQAGQERRGRCGGDLRGVTRPSMRFVPVKGKEQQGVLMLHRTRGFLVRQRTMLANALRSHLSEFGIVVAKGIENIAKLAAVVETKGGDAEGKAPLPTAAVEALGVIIGQLRDLKVRIDLLDKAILRRHRKNPESRRLATIPGIGPIAASALSATITDASQFKSGRQLAAWLGLVPRQNSSSGKERLGRISKQGDRYLRQLLVVGATSMLGVAQRRRTANEAWVMALLDKKPPRLVTIALANKMARIAWAIMARQETYKTRPLQA